MLQQTSAGWAQYRWWMSFFTVLFLGLVPALGWFLVFDHIEQGRYAKRWVSSVTISADPSVLPVVLGRQDLGQRAGANSASAAHLLVTREQSRWWLQNVSENRRALLVYRSPDGIEQEYHMRRFPLREGDQIRSASGASLGIADFSEPQQKITLTYESDGHAAVSYDVTHQNGFGVAVSVASDNEEAAKAGWLDRRACRLQRDAKEFSFPAAVQLVYDNRVQRTLAVFFDAGQKRLASVFDGLVKEDPSRRLVALGGVVSCEDRIAFPGASPGSLWLYLRDDAVFLGGTPGAFDAIDVFRSGEGTIRLIDYRWPANGLHPQNGADLGTLKGIYLGRTKYEVDQMDGFTLKAVSKIQKFVDTPSDNFPDRFKVAELNCITGRTTDSSSCHDGLSPPPDTRSAVRSFTFDADPNGDRSSSLFTLDWDFLEEEFNFLFIMALPAWVTLFAIGFMVTSLFPELGRSRLVQLLSFGTLKAQSETTANWIGRVFMVFLRFVCIFLCFKLLNDFRSPDLTAKGMIPVLVAAWSIMTLVLSAEIARHGSRWRITSVLAGALFWASLAALLAAGSITMHLLGVASANSAWESFGLKHHKGLLLFFAGLALFFGVPNRFWCAALDFTFISPSLWGKFIRIGLAMIILIIAAVMFAVGTEEGLFGVLQPSEINKIALVVVLGVLFVSFDRDSRYSRTAKYKSISPRNRALLLMIPVAAVWAINPDLKFYAGCFGLALVLYFLGKITFVWLGVFCLTSFIGVPAALQDFSPIVISVVLLGMVLAFGFFQSQELRAYRVLSAGGNVEEPYTPKLTPRRGSDLPKSTRIAQLRAGLWWQAFKERMGRNRPRAFTTLGMCLVSAAFAAAVVFAINVGAEISRGDDILRFDSIQRRIAFYLDRENYAEWGDQLYRAWSILGYNPELSCSWPYFDCLRSFGTSVDSMTAVEVMAVPAIQDDLISAFFIARFGTASMMVLVACKILFAATGMLGSILVFRRIPGFIQDETSRLFLSIVAFGAVCLFVIHWCIAWANLMGWAPVMGQPMTFISYARSHMLGMGFPSVVAILVVLRLGPPVYIRQWKNF